MIPRTPMSSARTADNRYGRSRRRVALAAGLAGVIAAMSITFADPVSPLAVTFLGLIALAVLSLAAGQLYALMLTVRAVRQMGETLNRFERDIRPIVENVNAMSVEAKRAAVLATAQVERADRLLTDVSRRVEDTAGIVQRAILAPARDGMALFQGIKAALLAFRDLKSRPRRSPNMGPVPRAVPDPGDDDHASFIG